VRGVRECLMYFSASNRPGRGGKSDVDSMKSRSHSRSTIGRRRPPHGHAKPHDKEIEQREHGGWGGGCRDLTI
jgi:hypothetical protein